MHHAAGVAPTLVVLGFVVGIATGSMKIAYGVTGVASAFLIVSMVWTVADGKGGE